MEHRTIQWLIEFLCGQESSWQCFKIHIHVHKTRCEGPNKVKLGSCERHVSCILCSHRKAKKPCEAGSCFRKDTEGERWVSPGSRFLLYQKCPSDIISLRVFISNIRLWLIFQNFQFQILFSCTSLLTCNLFVLLTSKSCQIEISDWASL